MQTPKILKAVIGLTVLVAFVSLISPLFLPPPLQTGLTSFAIILTFAAMLRYVYDTYKLAEFNYLPSASLDFTYSNDTPPIIHSLIQNHSRFSLQCWCKINATVYGNPVTMPGFYGGESSWDLQPYSEQHGGFDINKLLAKVGQAREQLAANATTENYKEQLRFKVEFWYIPIGSKIRIPNVSIPYYFDFKSQVLNCDF